MRPCAPGNGWRHRAEAIGLVDHPALPSAPPGAAPDRRAGIREEIRNRHEGAGAGVREEVSALAEDEGGDGIVIYLRKQTTRDGRPVFLPASRHAEERAREIKDGKVIKASETEDR